MLFRNPDLPLPERVADLVSRLTLEEKVSQMLHEAKAIERLGIPAYNYWNEGLHGVARNGRATVFPQAIGMAATWDPALIRNIASAIADEGRAKFHAALRAQGFSQHYQGLTFWSPNINIYRDPRWGRGQETWGEDPHLTGTLGSAFVRGLQGDDPRHLKASACAKHFAVHSGPEKDRHSFDARVDARDLWGTYLPAFRKLVVEAKVESVMGAYNRTLGEPCCASKLLLEDILRSRWGFQGHVVSDCWALTDIHKHHRVTADPVETAALALRRGCDLSCGCTFDFLGEAVSRGLITEAELDRALSRHLATRFKLGLFDPDERVPYAATPLDVVGCARHRRLAHEAAVKSVVLLKNQDELLPIRDTVRSILVVGPSASSGDVLLGNYFGFPASMSTLLEGIVAALPEGVRFDFRPAFDFVQAYPDPCNWPVFEAKRNDLVIACAGLSPHLEGEEGDAFRSDSKGDRDDIALPAAQADYLRRIADTGAKVVLVLTGGGAIALGDLAERLHAILWVGYPGQEGGHAVADILFGKSSPSGKLPVTFYRSTADLPPYDDYRMQGRTYRYFAGDPLYPFGFGLSYTRFAYADLRLSRPLLKPGQSLRATVRVSNTGTRDAGEVVQCYLTDVEASVPVPRHTLVGFKRIQLAAGASKSVSFTLTPEHLAALDDEGRPFLEPGRFTLTLGSASPGPRAQALDAPEPQTATFELL
jgi:beta-glucosidase